MISAGYRRKQLDLSFTEPRFMGRDLSAGIDLYGVQYDLSDYSAYDTTTYGMTLRTNFPLSLNARGSLRYVLRHDEIRILEGYCDPLAPQLSLALCEQEGTSIASLVGFGLSLDRRDDYLNPTRGFHIAANQDLAGLGGDVNYIKTEVEGGWWHPFTRAFVFSLTGSAGYVTGWNDDTVRINDRFFKGGNTFRGFEIAGIGPRDTSFIRADALGGKIFGIGSAELTIPTFLPEQYGIKASLFADVGTLGKLDKSDLLYRQGDVDCQTPQISNPAADPENPLIPTEIPNYATAGERNVCIRDDLSLRAAAGISIFWRSPMGPIRFDFSRVLAKEAYDKTETFRFTQTARF